MKTITLLPADSYRVYNQTLLNENDKKKLKKQLEEELNRSLLSVIKRIKKINLWGFTVSLC